MSYIAKTYLDGGVLVDDGEKAKLLAKLKQPLDEDEKKVADMGFDALFSTEGQQSGK